MKSDTINEELEENKVEETTKNQKEIEEIIIEEPEQKQEEAQEKTEEKVEEKGNKKPKRMKKKKTIGHKIFFLFKILMVLVILGIIGIYVFFKTDIFQEYKELWVQTAMTTMNHKYLATWFLSKEEIEEIMNKLKVENNENSDSNDIMVVELAEAEKKEVTVEKITGKGYVGFVMIVPDASKVKLVDGRQARKRFKTK